MQAHAENHRKLGFNTAALQSVIAGVLLIVLLVGALIAFNQIRAKKKDDRFYLDVLSAYQSAPQPEAKIRHLSRYIEQYPRGRHMAAVEELIQQADKQRGLDLSINASVVFFDRKTVPLSGRVQLLRPPQSMDEIRKAIGENADLAALKTQAKTDPDASLRWFDAVGALLQEREVKVIAETETQDGQIRFSHLAPGEYILYGVACAGSNVIGLFDIVTVEENVEKDGPLTCYSAYARDAQRRADRWVAE